MKLLVTLILPLAVGLSACNPSDSTPSGGTEFKTNINGKSSVTFSGQKNKTTRYGTEAGTSAFCTQYKDGTVRISLFEEGQDKKNSGWAKDGIYFDLRSNERPQDVTEITGYPHSVYAVMKEYNDDDGGTFNLDSGKPCSMTITRAGQNLDGKFKCERLRHSKKLDTITVYGWFECQLVEQNF